MSEVRDHHERIDCCRGNRKAEFPWPIAKRAVASNEVTIRRETVDRSCPDLKKIEPSIWIEREPSRPCKTCRRVLENNSPD